MRLGGIELLIKETSFNTKPLINSQDNGWQSTLPVTVSYDTPSLQVELADVGWLLEYTVSASTLISSENECRINVLTLEDAARTKDTIDILLERISFERTKVGAWYKRLSYCKSIHVNTVRGKSIKPVVEDIETRLFLLATQSANGIYTNIDRTLINYEFKLLITELHRIKGVHKVYPQTLELLDEDVAVYTAESSEDVRLQLSFLNHN